MPLWIRAVFASLLFPGIVAGVLPTWIAQGTDRLPVHLGMARWLGLPFLVVGVIGLLLTIWDFFASGHGTLAPWDAPTALVYHRLYRWVRNPMYLAVLVTSLGQAFLRSSGPLFLYVGLLAVAFQVRVVAFEEPALRRRFSAQYAVYCHTVRRWLPRPPAGPGARGVV